VHEYLISPIDRQLHGGKDRHRDRLLEYLKDPGGKHLDNVAAMEDAANYIDELNSKIEGLIGTYRRKDRFLINTLRNPKDAAGFVKGKMALAASHIENLEAKLAECLEIL